MSASSYHNNYIGHCGSCCVCGIHIPAGTIYSLPSLSEDKMGAKYSFLILLQGGNAPEQDYSFYHKGLFYNMIIMKYGSQI